MWAPSPPWVAWNVMKRAEPGWLVLALAGLAALLGSFLPFYTFTRDVDVTVWSRGLFPTAALIPLLGFAIGLEALFVLIRGHEPRSPFLNFTWEQVRLAVGAFMILLALSYVVQDRAGGTLGLGYLILSLSALATFAGGVMTRRAELARAPGEKVPEREARPVFRPAIATVNRVGSEFGKNVAGFGHNVRARLRERSKARAEMKAEAAPADPPPAAQEPAEELPADEPTAEEVAKAVTETPVEDVKEPTAEKVVDEPTVDMLVEEAPVEEPATKAAEEPPVEEPATEPMAAVDEPAVKDAKEAEAETPTRVAPLSAVAPEPDPEATPPPDGETSQSDSD